MEKKKKLVVNTTICDARQVQESTLAAYEKVVINSSAVLTDARSRELMDQYAVALNAASILDVEGDAQFSVCNGSAEIKPGQACPAGKVALIVNGSLDVAPGSEELLSHYCFILVNGTLSCPESLSGLITAKSTVNGQLSAYPDGCIRLKRTAVLDRTFHLRARQDAHYYAARRVVALDSGINFASLAEKNVHFTTKELLVAEGLAEAAIPLFDEQADITILPDGCTFVNDDAILDEALVRRYGGKLYINGDLTVNKASTPWLGQVSFLRINGDLLVTKENAPAVQAMDATYSALRLVAGTLLTDKLSVTVDRTMLEQAEDGLSLKDCVDVKFHKDVPPELIRERLVSLNDCVRVSCTEEQRSAVELAAEDVVSIDTSGKGLLRQVGSALTQLSGGQEENGDNGIASLAEKAKDLLGTKMVNSSSYVL